MGTSCYGSEGGRLVRRILTAGPLVDSDLTSCLLFTPTHLRRLMALGYSDAEQRRDEPRALLLDD